MLKKHNFLYFKKLFSSITFLITYSFASVIEIEVLITLKNNTKLSHQQMSTFYNLEKYFVTDIGMPGVFSVDNPSISSFEGKVNIESSSLNTSISIR